MPRKPADEKIAALRKKQEEIERQIRAHEREIKEQERKRHTTKLIAYGLLVQSELQLGNRDEEDVLKKLDKLLTQNSHRAAVGLPLLGIVGKPASSAPEDEPPRAKRTSTHGVKKDTSSTQETRIDRKKTEPPKARAKRELVEQDERELEQYFDR